jgi:1-acyl-sn-glycerol-3-phosphate acyltransferase
MIRFILAIIFLIPIALIACILLPIEWVLGKCNKKAKDYSSLRFVQVIFHILLWVSGVKVTIKGKENVPEETVLYVGNHRSIFDVLILYTQCKTLTGFVAKDSVEKIPVFRNWMRNLYCLFLNRSDIKQGLQVILQAIDYVKKGISICIFPEGTRNKGNEFELLPFKEGSFKIALKTGCPIVPVAMNRTADIFENHFPKIKKTHVILEYGTPIYPKDLSRDEQKTIGATCQNIIQEMLIKNAEQV